jgi:hypothetical protein
MNDTKLCSFGYDGFLATERAVRDDIGDDLTLPGLLFYITVEMLLQCKPAMTCMARKPGTFVERPDICFPSAGLSITL